MESPLHLWSWLVDLQVLMQSITVTRGQIIQLDRIRTNIRMRRYTYGIYENSHSRLPSLMDFVDYPSSATWAIGQYLDGLSRLKLTVHRRRSLLKEMLVLQQGVTFLHPDGVVVLAPSVHLTVIQPEPQAFGSH